MCLGPMKRYCALQTAAAHSPRFCAGGQGSTGTSHRAAAHVPLPAHGARATAAVLGGLAEIWRLPSKIQT